MRHDMETTEKTDVQYELSDQDRKTIGETLSGVAEKVGYRRPEEIDQETQASCAERINSLCERYPLEAIWDRLIYAGQEDIYGTSSDDAIPIVSSGIGHRTHSESVNVAETHRGTSKGQPHTFGLSEPAYDSIIQSEKDGLAGKETVNAILFGSYSHHSADEFNQFMRKINSRSTVSVVDLSDVGIRGAHQGILKVVGDVMKLPIAAESQDVVATNYLMPYLTRGFDELTKGKHIMAMLREAYRCLKQGGIILLNEENVTAKREANIDTTNLYLLAVSLQKIGFEEIKYGSGYDYETHVDKLEGNRSRLVPQATYRLVENKRPSGVIEVVNGLKSYDFMVMGKKPKCEPV